MLETNQEPESVNLQPSAANRPNIANAWNLSQRDHTVTIAVIGSEQDILIQQGALEFAPFTPVRQQDLMKIRFGNQDS